MAKNPTSIRLSDDARDIAKTVAKKLSIPRTAVYEMAIRLLARQENITLPTPKDWLPTGQKFAPGTRVRIADDLGRTMSHFPGGQNATVLYTYAQVYGGSNVDAYCLDIDDVGTISWYHEDQLTPIT